MIQDQIKNILIVGGGTAGWMTAAALAALLRGNRVNIRVVESQDIGTVGVGEATVPHIRHFNARLGIDERDFLLHTRGTFKLGIEFRDWNRIGDAFLHPFGAFGRPLAGVAFQHHWLRARQSGDNSAFGDYAMAVKMAQLGKFAHPLTEGTSWESAFSYAYHFDAGLYANYLRSYSERLGVARREGKIVDVEQDGETGFVRAVKLDDGQRIEADLFIDCSGFRGLLIEQSLKTGYEDWSAYLPCDRAWAVPCEARHPDTPFTRATARSAGWQWRIPLQHRVGNGYVFSSRFIEEQAARDFLLDHLEGPALAEARMLSFRTCVRRKTWNKNVIAIGLSCGFLEPLESTSIHLIQVAVTHLIEMLPDSTFRRDDEEEFNRLMAREYEIVRDFLVLHYHATTRGDLPFWDYCRTMDIPPSLRRKLALFAERGIVERYSDGLFQEPSWLSVYLGQGIIPGAYDPLSHRLSDAQLIEALKQMRGEVEAAATAMQGHRDFLNRYCASAAPARQVM